MIVTLGIGSLLVAGCLVSLSAYARPRIGVIPGGVQFAGLDWGNKPINIARSELEGWAQARLTERLPLSVSLNNGRKLAWRPTRLELGGAVDIGAILQSAEHARDVESAWVRIGSVFIGHDRIDIEPRWVLRKDAARDFLSKQVAPKVARRPRDAQFQVTKEGFRLVPEQAGIQLDEAAALNRISESLNATPDLPISLPLIEAAPRVLTEDVSGIDGEVSRFSTHYGERGNRRSNIENACSRINGTVLKPGDLFSYNRVVGPRLAENGFRLAPVIVRGRLEPGLGGGVCQTSTTLYNAVLLAGLKIVRRTHHAFPVHYASAGRDATVAYGLLDFQFKNDTEGPIAIVADGRGGRVAMRIFGKKVPGRHIRIERSHVSKWGAPVTTVIDPSMKPGTRKTTLKGHSGHRAKVWRIIKQDGIVVKRELVSSDYYEAVPYVVSVGARPVSMKKSLSPDHHRASPLVPTPPRPQDRSN